MLGGWRGEREREREEKRERKGEREGEKEEGEREVFFLIINVINTYIYKI